MPNSLPHLRRKSKKNRSEALPLFAWQPSPALSPAAKRIAARFRLPAATAAVIAALAGFQAGGDAHV